MFEGCCFYVIVYQNIISPQNILWNFGMLHCCGMQSFIECLKPPLPKSEEYLLVYPQACERGVQEREGLVRAEHLDGQGDGHGYIPEELGELGRREGAP